MSKRQLVVRSAAASFVGLTAVVAVMAVGTAHTVGRSWAGKSATDSQAATSAQFPYQGASFGSAHVAWLPAGFVPYEEADDATQAPATGTSATQHVLSLGVSNAVSSRLSPGQAAPAITLNETDFGPADSAAIISSVLKQHPDAQPVTVGGTSGDLFNVGDGWTSIIWAAPFGLMQVSASGVDAANLTRVAASIRGRS